MLMLRNANATQCKCYAMQMLRNTNAESGKEVGKELYYLDHLGLLSALKNEKYLNRY